MDQDKNYRITTEWKPLTDIMGNDYEVNENYNIHVNTLDNGNALCFTYRIIDPPTNGDRGAEYGSYSNINVVHDTGDDVYLRAFYEPLSVEIQVTSISS